ncbi:MAG TPA: PLP-dependent aminotransferase family protein [Candidatus Acidoferrum sp.]|nr:PLP-dependent aminotransferase family protein [Candidatus Acidoferrum sp.]
MILPDMLAGLALDEAGAAPIYRQIYARIAGAVLDGRLAPGARLPSARSLAAQLSIARGTVETAYQLLAGEGYIVARGAAGTIVAPALDRTLLTSDGRTSSRPAVVSPPAGGMSVSPPALFRMGLPALDVFPHKIWSRLFARHARSLGPVDLAYQPPAGHEALRVQVARYLAVARGVSCAPEQVFITGGFQGALGLIVRCLLQPGDVAWVEDPGYDNARNALRLAGARIVGVPIDRDGLDVAWAVAKAPPARLAVVTPTHQSPLTVTLSLPRRMALLAWAAAAPAWIVEDDYDSEYRYLGKPLPALKSLDRHDRVLFVGSFSKVLSPGLRVGYLVVPPGLVERFAAVADLLQPPPAALIQATIAAFLEQGYLGRHIRRMRQLYRERRTALVEALREQLSPMLDIALQPGGMHLVARLPDGTDDVALVAGLVKQGIGPSALSAWGAERPYAPGLLISFTNVDVRKAPQAARRLAEALHAAKERKPRMRGRGEAPSPTRRRTTASWPPR